MIHILACGKMSEKGLALLKSEPGIEVHVEKDVSPENLKEILPKFDAMAVRSDTTVTSELLDRATKLKVIVRSGIGVDNIDVTAATTHGVIVMNTPAGNTITTAEHAISMLLALSRHIPQATASLKAGKWEKKQFTGTEVFGKTLGLFGLGNVGRIVAERALGLKMKIIAFDPFISKEAAEKLSVRLVTEEEILKTSDFISIHVPLTKQTRNLIDAKALSQMKKSALLVQCSRGGIVNEEDLYKALKAGEVRGAALDVFETEPPGEHPLFTLDNVICTPHLGAATADAQRKVGIETAEQLIDYFKKGIVRNAVNMPSVSPEVMAVLKPYLELAEVLGVFQGQVNGAAGLKSIEIEYSGKMTKQNLTPLTRAVVKGFLSQHLEKGVNHVNALVIAEERGIDIKTTSTAKSTAFTNLVSVNVNANGKSSSVSGTVVNNDEPRIVKIDRFYLEVIPKGNILFMRNYDKPSVIGNIGMLLGNHNINISRFQLGLHKETGLALSLINVDSQVGADILKQLLSLPHIIEVKQLIL